MTLDLDPSSREHFLLLLEPPPPLPLVSESLTLKPFFPARVIVEDSRLLDPMECFFRP
jgi:hypothetical protein